MPNSEYQQCIDLCLKCASVSNFCASSCLEEDPKAMAYCIQLDMECAAICYTAAQFMSLDSRYAREICHLCADICASCADECSKHDASHCKECADACRRCAEECRKVHSPAVA